MYEFFFILYVVATTPILLAIVVVLIVVILIAVIVSQNKKQRESKQFFAKIEEESRLRTLQAENDAAVRKAAVTDKYDPETAEKILGGQIWQGMTAEQLRYAVGEPAAVDKVVTKRTSKEIWKYFQQTATRFDLRVTLENGLVVGWQMK
jgi:outer membrane protein assembly factor BamE (lipoprotein component of BamABCDE complex)